MRHPQLVMLFVYILGWCSGFLIGSNEQWHAELVCPQPKDAEVGATPLASRNERGKSDNDPLIGKSVWDVIPLEHTQQARVFQNQAPIVTDAYNPFFQYMDAFAAIPTTENEPPQITDFPNLPMWDTWAHYLECYHNHFHRFRGKKVTLMEIGVQSGGKIAMFRDYFGPGLTYVGIDINKSTMMFGSADWIHIEIGDSSDLTFLAYLRSKYPRVDIFLDDGGHRMWQQMTALREMLPHVHKEGVYMCEDLATSWAESWGGIPYGHLENPSFREDTMMGLALQTMVWLNRGWIRGNCEEWDDLGEESPSYYKLLNKRLFAVVSEQVKHIHWYNQAIVYEKGTTYRATRVRSVGKSIPYEDSGVYPPVNWGPILKRVQNYTKSPWNY